MLSPLAAHSKLASLLVVFSMHPVPCCGCLLARSSEDAEMLLLYGCDVNITETVGFQIAESHAVL